MNTNYAFLNKFKITFLILAFAFSFSTYASGNNDRAKEKIKVKIKQKDKRNNFIRNGNRDDNHKHTRTCGHNDGGTSDSIPLDGGLSILLVGAAAFGIKKLRDSKNENI
ncbi:PID-CTERM protein-sorting domain-containing protein [Mariniflexile sp.]|uniref:PID-CTERM protein-sorting domain-containing protein n=1 Tax=Mariniflexile sp. TaxID=1979402 RepID=UPI0035673579